MSGPKHCSYSVNANAARMRREREERERREREAATAAITKLNNQIDSLVEAVNAFDPGKALEIRREHKATRSHGNSHAEILALPQKLEFILGKYRAVISQHNIAVEDARRFKSATDEIARQHVEALDKSNAAIAKWRDPLIDRLLTIQDEAKGALRKRVQSVIDLARKDDPDRAALQTDLMALQGRYKEQQAQIARAGELSIALAGLEDPQAKALVATLTEVEAGEKELDSKLLQRAEQATADLREKEDRRYVAQVLADGFRELGYDVSEGFETAFNKGGAMQLSHSEREGYAVEVSFDATSIAFDAELVRIEDNSQLTVEERERRDASAERSWCNDLAQVTSGARASGIVGKAKAKRRIGAQPVRSVVAEGQRKTSSAARKSAGARQERAIKS